MATASALRRTSTIGVWNVRSMNLLEHSAVPAIHLVRNVSRASGTAHAARLRASDVRIVRKALKPLSTPARVWPRNGLHLQRITKG